MSQAGLPMYTLETKVSRVYNVWVGQFLPIQCNHVHQRHISGLLYTCIHKAYLGCIFGQYVHPYIP